LEALNKSEYEYGGSLLKQVYHLLLAMLLVQSAITILGTIMAVVNFDDLATRYVRGNGLENIFYIYNIFSAESFWVKILELALPILTIMGFLIMQRWGNSFLGNRMEEEVQAPFPKEMQYVLIGTGFYIVHIILGVIVAFIANPEASDIVLIIANISRVIGAILNSVGFSRAGYYLELYTTRDKKKFFSLAQEDD
jgi:hypothetical protein